MAKQGRWFSAVQRILNSFDSEEKDKRANNTDKSDSKNRWQINVLKLSNSSTPMISGTAQPQAEAKSMETASEKNKHDRSVLASATATMAPRTHGCSNEEIAAIKIQTTFKQYMEIRALRAMRGEARLKSLVDGNTVKRQTADTLYRMQMMTKIQTQIYSRRAKKEEEKKALQKHIQVKHDMGLEKIKIGENWDHSHQSKQQIEAVLTMKQEAASRRQKALAYAFSHQWRNRNSSTQSVAPMFTDLGNPNWGWSWMERWMAAARPWESQTTSDKEPKDRSPVKSAGSSAIRTVTPPGAISVKTPRTPKTPSKSSQPLSWQSPSTPSPKALAGRTIPASPRCSQLPKQAALRRTTSLRSERTGDSKLHRNDSLRRTTSMHSEGSRRQSLGGAPVVDDISPTSTPVIPSYMQSTESVRVKSWHHGPSVDKLEIPNRGRRTPPVSWPSVKKRLSFPIADKLSIPSPNKPRKERARRSSENFEFNLASPKNAFAA